MCNGRTAAGAWRLPNRKELESLLDYGHFAPAVPSGNPFVAVAWDLYWSSTTYLSDPGPAGAWVLDFRNAYVAPVDKTLTYYVWPVRGGP